ncbi:MAG: proton-conducting transporter transmembrane domain-containing protein [Candidatus Limnocylindrales bacterium]
MIELALLAMIAPLVAAAGVWFLPDEIAGRVAVLAFAVGAVGALGLAVPVLTGGPARALGGLIVVDALGAAVLVLVVMVSVIAVGGSPSYLRHERSLRPRDRARYWALLVWFVSGLAVIPLFDNLGLLWVAVEGTTIVSALLVGFARTPAAIEAAWKYLILGSVGIGFALLGTLLAYASSVEVLGETSDALGWTRLMAIAPLLDPGLVRLAFLFTLVGYGTKTGLAPFHTWLPDAHSQAPSPVSAVLSGATLAVSLYALARFHLVASRAIGPELSSTLLVVFGLLSLAVALPFIVAQGDLKRLLAYSSMEHMGLGALALGFGGPIALGGLVLHLLAHGLTKASLFIAGGGLVEAGRSRRIARLRGSLQAAPVDGRAFLAGALLLSGLPPSALFVSEVAILFGGFAVGWGPAATLAALLLALAVAGFLFHAGRVSFGMPRGRTGVVAVVSGWRGLTIAAPLIAVAVLGVWTPEPVARAIERVVAILGGSGA